MRAVARRIAAAASVSIFEDLGIQQAPHSTLNSYLEKLLYLLTGNFAQAAAAMNLHTALGEPDRRQRTADARARPSAATASSPASIPCNVIPDEILTDHPKRFRAMLVESANPAHSLADSPRMREALDALDLVVVIDVAMTETARLADYVLPAASQFEKWEATFFTLEFPHERLPPARAARSSRCPARCPSPRSTAAWCARSARSDDDDLAPLHDGRGRRAAPRSPRRSSRRRPSDPKLGALAPVVLYETLGPTLPDGAAAAAAAVGRARTCAR